MTNFEQTLLQEVAALPQSHRADVLAFVRYLRISLMDEDEMERQYDEVIKAIRKTAKRYKITQKDIEEEIRAVRAERARHS
jgi:alpha-D-ribose 1-methylphosphonate 5-triphosphate diphosphatase PhnM